MKRIEIPNKVDLDHPEHFDDLIREYKAGDRYIPTPLESLLYEMAGHRCTICEEPFMELHHIKELKNGGETTYGNLIVLCPNCHTRVHQTNTPTPKELRQYKLKQEIASELPAFSKIDSEEKELIKELIAIPKPGRLNYDKLIKQEAIIEKSDGVENLYRVARDIVRNKVGYKYLEETGIIAKNVDGATSRTEVNMINELTVHKTTFFFVVEIRLTSKGLKWINYLEETKRINLVFK